MGDVVIAGIGQVKVGEHWDKSLRNLSHEVIQLALKDSAGLEPQAMYIGNFMAPVVSSQANLGALIADNSGLIGIESYTLEAGEASGAAALRTGYLAVASGFVNAALVVGVEKCTDNIGADLEAAVSQGMDSEYEMVHGLTTASQAGLLMQRYLHKYEVPRVAMGEFALLSHENAVTNPFAMFRKSLSYEAYERAPAFADPLNVLDMAPYADGAAAVLLTRPESLPSSFAHVPVRIVGSSVVVDTLALHDRVDPLAFEAVTLSVERACRRAGIMPGDVDFLEISDQFTIYAALSLEAAGFAKRGESWKLARERRLNLHGELPICTFGGSKARGNPVGATGIYQIVEAVLQLRGEAGANQVVDAKRGLVQSLGGPAATVITHILEAYQP